MRRIFAVLLTYLAFAFTLTFAQAPRQADGSANPAENEKAIKQLLNSSVDAWNQHDAKAFSMVFAEDADFTNVVGMSAHGRLEIEKFHAPLFATRFKDTKLKITETKVRFITPEVAAVDARWEMTGAKRPDGREIPLRKGLLNFTITGSSSDQWLIAVMHNMDLPSQEPNR